MRYVTTFFSRPKAPHQFMGRCFTAEWVDRLYRNLMKWDDETHLVVLTNHPQSDFAEPVEVIDLMFPERDWTCLMEMLRPEAIGDKALTTGLDTVLTAPLRPLFENTWDGYFAARSFHEPYTWNNAWMGINREHADRMWKTWLERKKMDVKNVGVGGGSFGLKGNFSELAWMRKYAGPDLRMWDEIMPRDAVRRYAVDLDGCGVLPEEAAVIWFAGDIKQHTLAERGEKWVLDNWGDPI